MGLEERINDEMVVDAESFLEEHFKEANRLFRIFENGNIDIQDDFEEAPWKERLLIHLIGRRYAFEGNQVDSPALPYEYFYARIDKDDSTIRSHMNDLNDDLFVEKDPESGDWQLIPDSLPKALNRIEGLES